MPLVKVKKGDNSVRYLTQAITTLYLASMALTQRELTFSVINWWSNGISYSNSIVTFPVVNKNQYNLCVSDTILPITECKKYMLSVVDFTLWRPHWMSIRFSFLLSELFNQLCEWIFDIIFISVIPL